MFTEFVNAVNLLFLMALFIHINLKSILPKENFFIKTK